MFHTVQNHMTYKGHSQAQRDQARRSQAEHRKVAAEQAWLGAVQTRAYSAVVPGSLAFASDPGGNGGALCEYKPGIRGWVVKVAEKEEQMAGYTGAGWQTEVAVRYLYPYGHGIDDTRDAVNKGKWRIPTDRWALGPGACVNKCVCLCDLSIIVFYILFMHTYTHSHAHIHAYAYA